MTTYRRSDVIQIRSLHDNNLYKATNQLVRLFGGNDNEMICSGLFKGVAFSWCPPLREDRLPGATLIFDGFFQQIDNRILQFYGIRLEIYTEVEDA